MGIIKYLTMDELKILSIPSEMLKLFNHSIFPTRDTDKVRAPPMNIHNIQCMNVGIVKYMTMDELKPLSIPSEMLKFYNHSSFPRKGHPTRSLHPSTTYTTSNV